AWGPGRLRPAPRRRPERTGSAIDSRDSGIPGLPSARVASASVESYEDYRLTHAVWSAANLRQKAVGRRVFLSPGSGLCAGFLNPLVSYLATRAAGSLAGSLRI